MEMDGELGRLQRLYEDFGDEQLLHLGSDPESLTENAQYALGQELKRRRLSMPSFGRSPLAGPQAASRTEAQLESSDEGREGAVNLIGFYDGLMLSRCCAVLEEDGIAPAVEEIIGDSTAGEGPSFNIWISAADLDRSKAILREKLGFFPTAEVDEREEVEDQEAEPEPDQIVAEFESRAEAEEALTVLMQSGLLGSIEDHPSDSAVSRVLVKPEDCERALGILSERLGTE